MFCQALRRLPGIRWGTTSSSTRTPRAISTHQYASWTGRRPRRPRQFRRHVDGRRQDGSSYGVFAQRFAAAGARRGAEFRVNTYTTGEQARPSVASDSVGNFVVAWEGDGQDGSGYGVFAQRFGGLRPAALAVVDGGNGVLGGARRLRARRRPGSNISGAPRTFQGQASEFTGPPGSSTRSARRVAQLRHRGRRRDRAPAPDRASPGALLGQRPAGHVDVSVREQIVPDVLGQDQRWVLHVGRQLHRRAGREPVLPLHRDAAAPRRHRRLLRPRSTARPARRRASRWRCSCSSRRKERDTSRPPARRRCSPTFPRATPSAGGSRSWPAGRWSAAAAAATTARRSRSRASRWRSSSCARWTRALSPPACAPPHASTTFPRAARSAAGSRSWPVAAWSPDAAAATTARRRRSRASRWASSSARRSA